MQRWLHCTRKVTRAEATVPSTDNRTCQYLALTPRIVEIPLQREGSYQRCSLEARSCHATSLFTLLGTRLRRKGFGGSSEVPATTPEVAFNVGEDIIDARWRENVLPRKRDSLRANSLDMAYSPHKRRVSVKSARHGWYPAFPFPPLSLSDEMKRSSSGQVGFGARVSLQGVVVSYCKVSSTVLSCVVQCFLSI